MKKIKSIKILVPNSCLEDWDNMSPNEQGRHCISCDKTVIDFSLFTDKQLIEFLNKTTGKICGHISPWQLNRELVYVEPRNHFLHKLLFGTALTLGITGSANANYNPNQKPLAEQYAGNNTENHETDKDTGTHLTVTVIDDSTRQAVPYAGIIVSKGINQINSWQTDMYGKVDIYSLSPGKYKITVSYGGYTDRAQNITLNKTSKTIVIRIKRQPIELIPHEMVNGGLEIKQFPADTIKNSK
ncbi:MAG TPA: carboxypeptidase-like regulatory domain-containing protein [Bacteroidia bacterium]|nr:carboxypeptidase-like regulatory domain-containing protein [Bacteroidia bacterium]